MKLTLLLCALIGLVHSMSGFSFNFNLNFNHILRQCTFSTGKFFFLINSIQNMVL